MEGKICHWQSHIRKCSVIDSLKFNRHRAGSAYITWAVKGVEGSAHKVERPRKLRGRRKAARKRHKSRLSLVIHEVNTLFHQKFCFRAVQLTGLQRKPIGETCSVVENIPRSSLIFRQKLIFLLCRKLHSICRHTKNTKKKMKAEYQSAKNVRCFLISLSGLTDCPLSARNMRAITKTAPKPR